MNKSVLTFIIMLLFNISTFSFSLSDLDFDKSLKKGEVKTKKYTLINNTDKIKKYLLSTNSNQVEVKPKSFVLAPQKEKEFTIDVLGQGDIGENEYMLTIIEKNLNKEKKEGSVLYLNKVVQIKQKYFLK